MMTSGRTRHKQSTREKVTLLLLTTFFLLCSFRYFPDQPARSFIETLIHMLTVAPFTVGATLIFVSAFHRMTGDRLPWDRIFRIFLTFGILVELFFGIYYLKLA